MPQSTPPTRAPAWRSSARRSLTASTLAALAARLGLALHGRLALVDAELAAEGSVRIGDRAAGAERLRAARADLVALVARTIASRGRSDGMPREEARDRLRVAAAGLRRAGGRAGDGPRQWPDANGCRAGSPRRDLGTAERAAMDAVEGVAAGGGAQAARRRRDGSRAGWPAAVSSARWRCWCVRSGSSALGGLAFHRAALDALIADIGRCGGRTQTRASTSPTFKARYGLSRKFAIPLLEFLDRERVTRRVGDVRVVLRERDRMA